MQPTPQGQKGDTLLRHSIYQGVSILGALIIWSAVDERIKGTVGRLTARGDVWQAGFEAGYDRGVRDARRPVAVDPPRPARNNCR